MINPVKLSIEVDEEEFVQGLNDQEVGLLIAAIFGKFGVSAFEDVANEVIEHFHHDE